MSWPRGRSRTLRLIVAASAMAVATALALSGCTQGGDASSTPSQTSNTLPSAESNSIKAAVTDAMKLVGAPGAIVGVWAPWAGDYEAGLGTTTLKGKEPVTPNMPWRVGSVTKSMTCTVLLSLVQKGEVALNDPVSKYLPRVVGIDGLTLGQLCQNTSGLGDYMHALGPQFVDNPQRPYVPMELLSDGMGEPRAGAPGERWAYSNTGYILLGMALQAATGQDWQSLYNSEVFGPLGMSSSSLPSGTSIPGSALHGYATSLDAVTGASQCGTVMDDTQLAPSATWTASGVVSSLSDLKTFAQSFASASLLNGDAKKAAWTTVPVASDAATWQTYGMGGIQLGPMRGHDGAVPGFITSMLSDPASGLTVVVMLNNSTSGADYAQALAMRIAAIAAAFKPAAGQKAPTIKLPWTADAAAATVDRLAVCRAAGTKPTTAAGPAGYHSLPSN
ncbi:hypothetical protein GCM10027568_26040 [Humibacter soli]